MSKSIVRIAICAFLGATLNGAIAVPHKSVAPKTEDNKPVVEIASPPPVAPVIAPTDSLSETVAAPSTSKGKVAASVGITPTWTTKKGAVGTENSASLGYFFNPTTYLGYEQDFNSNVFSPALATSGLNPTWDMGYAQFKANNLVVSKEAGLALSYEARVFVPTDPTWATPGGITMVRNYAKLAKSLGNGNFLTLMEVPIVHVFNKAGNPVDGANPGFENRVYLILDLQITSKLSFSLPLMLNSVVYRDVQAGYKNNGTTQHKLWTWPELDYAISQNFTVGAAFRSDNLVVGDLSNTAIRDGIEGGVAQLVLKASL